MKMYSQKSVYILTFGRAYEKCRLYWTTDCQSAWRCVQGSSQWVRASRCSATCEHKTLLQNLMHYVLLVEGVGSNTYMWDFFFFFTYRVGARKVVATHHLHVGFFYQRHPELVSVAGVRTQHLSIMVHRQEIIYYHLNRGRQWLNSYMYCICNC